MTTPLIEGKVENAEKKEGKENYCFVKGYQVNNGGRKSSNNNLGWEIPFRAAVGVMVRRG